MCDPTGHYYLELCQASSVAFQKHPPKKVRRPPRKHTITTANCEDVDKYSSLLGAECESHSDPSLASSDLLSVISTEACLAQNVAVLQEQVHSLEAEKLALQKHIFCAA